MLQMKVAELPTGRVNMAGKRVTVGERRQKEMHSYSKHLGSDRL